MRVAIYARVSTDDGSQDPENQLHRLRQWVQSCGHVTVAEFVDRVSGAKGTDKRPHLSAMLEAAHRREFDMVVVWALDRLSREGMIATVMYLQRLAAAGVAFHSFTEPALCTENELVRDILLAVMSSLAKVERQKISDRTKAGLARARANGKRLGRAPLGEATRQKLRMALNQGTSWRTVSATTGIPYSTVHKHARAMGYSPPGALFDPPASE